MRLGILGGTGQVGIELVGLARANRIDVSAPSRDELDITDRSAVERWTHTGRFDAIVNCAAYTAVDAAESAPKLAYAVNRDGAANVGAASASAGVPVIHLSTEFVFDGEKASAYTEDDVPRPVSVYGASKLAGEEAILREGDDVIVLRVSWVFSAHRKNFVKTIVERAASGSPLQVVDDQIGGPCGAAGVARAAWSLAGKAKRAGRRLYHFESRPFVSRYEFAKIVVEEAHRGGILHSVPTIAAISTAQANALVRRPLNSRLAGNKLARDFGVPVHDWRIELGQTVSRLARDRAFIGPPSNEPRTTGNAGGSRR